MYNSAGMSTHTAKILEIRADDDGLARAMLGCPPAAVPCPGRYLLAHNPADTAAALATPLFATGYAQHGRGFTAAPPIPPHWAPGDVLHLAGPLGQGFAVPDGLRRLALVALGTQAATLLPLALRALAAGAEVALFTAAPLPRLPASLEANPLTALPEALPWADFLALSGPLAALAALPEEQRAALPATAQMLVETPLACGGLAECGLCALPASRGKWVYACSAGPVLALGALLPSAANS